MNFHIKSRHEDLTEIEETDIRVATNEHSRISTSEMDIELKQEISDLLTRLSMSSSERGSPVL